MLVEEDKIPEDFGFFTKKDIVKAYQNMIWNCPTNKPDPEKNTSTLLFDHLVDIGVLKIKWEAESIWLTSDPKWLELKKLREEILSWTQSKDIKTIPSEFQEKYNAIMDKTWSANEQLAKNRWYFSWSSSWLYQKQLLLCELARWLYFNTNEVTKVKQWTTTYNVDTSYNQCKKQLVPNIITQTINKQQSLQITNFKTAMDKIQESVNQYSNTELNTLLDTTQTLTNKMTDISKKIDQKMKNCNPTDA